MYINGTAPICADRVDRTVKTVEILTGCERQNTGDDLLIEDKFDSAPVIESMSTG